MTGPKRFYWVKLQVATAMYRAKEEELEDVEEVCRQLINDSRCPKLEQVEAYLLPSKTASVPPSLTLESFTNINRRSFVPAASPGTTGQPKNQLDRALEAAANCEKDVDANKPADKHALNHSCRSQARRARVVGGRDCCIREGMESKGQRSSA
jgi:hypothetical protein